MFSVAIAFIFLGFFTLASGFFSASETSLFSISSLKLRIYQHHMDRKKKLISTLLSSPQQLLLTILMLNVAVNIMIQNISANIFENTLGWGFKVGLPLILTLVFGEIIPKSLAFLHNEKVAYFVCDFIYFFYRLLSPIRVVVTRLTSYISRLMFFFLKREKEISSSELEHVLIHSQKEGVLSKEEIQWMRGYLRFQSIVIKDVMQPREDIISYDIEDPLEELFQIFSEKKCTRIPIIKNNFEEVLGLIDSKTLLINKHVIESKQDLVSYLQKPLYVPETLGVNQLLKKLTQTNTVVALVVDEYGSVVGLVTKEDLIEIIVGEIIDEREGEKEYTLSGEDIIIANGRLELVEFEKIFDCSLPNPNGAVTLGGWLIEQMEEIPKPGKKITAFDFLFHVLASEPNRIRKIYVKRLKKVLPEKNKGIDIAS